MEKDKTNDEPEPEQKPAENPRKAAKLAELARRRESGEIAAENFNTNDLLWFIEDNIPLTSADLRKNGNQALVLTSDEFEELGLFDVILKDGTQTTLDPDDFPKDDVLIIYPEDLG